jgi:hypothetical protein
MKVLSTLAGMIVFGLAVPAVAAPVVYTFNTTGNTSVNGAYGNSLSFTATKNGSQLGMTVSAFQSKQSTNDITKAYLGAFSTGLGVTGYGDSNGSSNYHQFDNAGGYTDFVLLTFDRAVSLSSVTLNSYTLGNSRSKDNDLAIFNASALTNPNLTVYDTVPSAWSAANGSGANGYRVLGDAGVSTRWLVGAAFIPTNDRDDGFKIASIKVAELVAAAPEPGTWAMMLMGFGAIGGVLRLRRRDAVASART